MIFVLHLLVLPFWFQYMEQVLCFKRPLIITPKKKGPKIQQGGRFLLQGSRANKISPAKTRQTLLFLFLSDVKQNKTCPSLFWGVCLIFVCLLNPKICRLILIAHKQPEVTNSPLIGLWPWLAWDQWRNQRLCQKTFQARQLTALHVSPPFRPLLCFPRYTQGDFFPVRYRPGRGMVPGVCLAGMRTCSWLLVGVLSQRGSLPPMASTQGLRGDLPPW